MLYIYWAKTRTDEKEPIRSTKGLAHKPTIPFSLSTFSR